MYPVAGKNVVKSQFYEANCYIRGTNLVVKYNYKNGDKSEYTYYTQNAHGDVVNLTNADGEVTKKYTYDAFGVEKDIVDSDTNAFRYCGEYYDKETATVYLRARYYNPSTGRFISRDSVTGDINDPLSLNLYTYCHNNPLLNFDPSGNSIRSWLNDRVDDWKTGIDMLKNECWGDGGKYFASYSEGVADTLCGYGDIANKLLDHPIQTTCDSIGQLITDPIKPVKNVGAFYSNLASASYNHDWNSVAYSLGGATTHTAVIGCTYTVASSIPNSINMKIPQISAAALTTGKTVLALSTATARISTAGAVSIGEAVAGVNILYSKGKPSGKNTSKSIRKVDDNYLKQKGFDAHELKKDALGSKANIAQYDIYQDANGDLWVYRKGGKGEGIPLYEKIK